MGKFYGHPAVTHKTYAGALESSWDDGKPDLDFHFLLSQADKGDLREARNEWSYKHRDAFRRIIDGALKNPEPAGTRHQRSIEMVRADVIRDALNEITGTNVGKQELGNILVSYLTELPLSEQAEKLRLQMLKEVASDEATLRVMDETEEMVEGDVALDVIEAVDRGSIDSIDVNWWEHWQSRKDLLDYAVTKSPEFIIKFIKKVGEMAGSKGTHTCGTLR